MSTPRCRLAIADDDPVFRFAIASWFEAEPEFELVGVAGSGPDAIQMVEAATPPVDLLVLDLNMPGADGYQVTSRLSCTCPDLKCLVLTGTDEEEVAPRLRELGVAYMQKGREPFALSERLLALAAD
jgi:two-component system, NarL family, response regulator DesR